MQPVYPSCYPLDSRCYEQYGLSEAILMEHAALGMARVIEAKFPAHTQVLIVCGVGNNGADGMVLARQLHGKYAVRLMVPFGVHSSMAKRQLSRAKAIGVEMVEVVEESAVIVDALFGAGLSRELDPTAQTLLRQLNALDGYKIACDIPSGIGMQGCVMPLAFKADITCTMGAYKEALFLDESKGYCGEIVRVDLGIASQWYAQPSDTMLLEPSDLRLPHRHQHDTHKGSFGHAVVVSGEMEGASILSAMASSALGAGLTTLLCHEKMRIPPYLMQSTTLPATTTAVAIGMGLGESFDHAFLRQHLVDSSLPVVLDADSFAHPTLRSILEQSDREIVITPHPKEFVVLWEALSGERLEVEELQRRRFEMVRTFGRRYPHVTLLLKGAVMLIIHQHRLYLNPWGSSRLSKGGSGDVLSGLIVALLAQGYSGIEATLHASLALTQASANYRGASYAMLSTDLVEQVRRLED